LSSGNQRDIMFPSMEKIGTKIIGLTGPIAAGKDQVARRLKRLGAVVINVDQLAHTLYKAQSPVWMGLFREFGSKILRRGGEINRKKLADIVFSDENELKRLNSIIHPALKEAVIKEIRAKSAEHSAQMIVINAAVLKEIGLIDIVDEVWVVLASKENRLKRLVGNGLTKEQAAKRINSQLSQGDYLKMADVVIRNDGTLKELNEKVRAGFKLFSSKR